MPSDGRPDPPVPHDLDLRDVPIPMELMEGCARQLCDSLGITDPLVVALYIGGAKAAARRENERRGLA